MSSLWAVADLEIVGYAEALSAAMLPAIVPPVFRPKAEPERALVPPYSFNAGYLCNATVVTRAELEHLRDAREITLLDAPLPAREGYELWIDRDSRLRYEPREDAARALRGVADEAIQVAKEAWRNGNFAEAERQSGIAILADDSRIDPLVINAAIRRRDGNCAGERLMVEAAAPRLSEEEFRALVDRFEAPRPLAPLQPARAERRPMRGMACLQAA